MSNRRIRPIEEIDRKATITEVQRVLAEHVVEDEAGFYSRWVEIETDVLQDVLTLLTASAEDLLLTIPGLALANAAWGEGHRATLGYSRSEGRSKKPESPYSAPLLAALRSRKADGLEGPDSCSSDRRSPTERA